MPSTRFILACILITLLTIIGIADCLYTTQASQTSVTRPQANSRVIGGRWKLVQVSLGIQLLPDTLFLPIDTAIRYPPSRIGFRRKKRTPLAPLHFAYDALSVSKLSLKEFVVSLRRISHEEAKVEALRSDNRRGRARLGRGSFGIRKRHISTPR